ncbi:MAG: hypothetical protein ACRD0S_05620, partial [Acidimicrobiales bacterium]
EHPLVDVTRRQFDDRPMSSPEALYEGATMVIDRHRDRLSLDPRFLANFYTLGGVSAARLHRYSDARRLLLSAVRTRPKDPMRWARLALALAPPLGDRVWRSRRFGAVAS